jgi:hypothetical protein
LVVSGKDAGEFLQRLCSQDVLGAAEGVSVPAAFLDAKGKLVATCLVKRLGEAFWLETAASQGERLAQLLERYHFTEKLTIGVPPGLEPCIEWIGAAGAEPPPSAGGQRFVVARHGVQFVREHGDVDAGRWAASACDAATAEALRMVAGLVAVGVETEPTTLALEAALDDHCSTTKGCYTGQEIVARIHTYGHVNRRLCLLELAEGAPIDAPQPLHEVEDDLPVGRVMRAVAPPRLAGRVGLGYLPKDFQAPGTALKLADGTAVAVVAWGGA